MQDWSDEIELHQKIGNEKADRRCYIYLEGITLKITREPLIPKNNE